MTKNDFVFYSILAAILLGIVTIALALSQRFSTYSCEQMGGAVVNTVTDRPVCVKVIEVNP